MRKQVGRILAWSWVVATTAVLVVAVVVPRLAGATPYTVVTGSMRPGLPPGTLAVVRPTPVEEIGIGDVITYQLESGKETVVTHRVVAVGLDATGTRCCARRVTPTRPPTRSGCDRCRCAANSGTPCLTSGGSTTCSAPTNARWPCSASPPSCSATRR
ncbi:S26 family signal peptidase [Nocardioides alcanivorans]|uniref:S26 family signal peptidase n=1 Tax=Nocardioides alcanivorans TaxID=2897352 RepID=UPI001F3F7393|nr:S26 family signal peptidase [Nocardioides alcanivorans]